VLPAFVSQDAPKKGPARDGAKHAVYRRAHQGGS